MLSRNDIQIRDPFIVALPTEHRYCLFGTTDVNPWNQVGSSFQAYLGEDLESWQGPFTVFTPPQGFWGTHDFWAPEVHRYNGRYYMLASFIAKGRLRGTHILVSDSLLGPYLPLTEHPATPSGWQCLDGTLHIDKDGRPWLVFCREWVQVHDGEIHAMPLSADLTRPMGNPVLLFRASQAIWPRTLVRRDGSGLQDARVTDGPFVHRQNDGTLVMLWSSLGAQGYAMSCAISDSGAVTGPWRHATQPLIASDGGHGMVFTSFDGRLHMTYHTPNKTPLERFCYREVCESPDGLVLLGEEGTP